jgi:hypothetical protein
MRRVARSVPRRRGYIALAILAFAVAATAAMTTGAVRAPIAAAGGTPALDTCGYPGKNGSDALPVTDRKKIKFNEIGIIEGFSVTTDDGTATGNPLTVNTFYSDEHALTLGTPPPDPTVWDDTYVDPGTTIKRIDDAGTNPAAVNNTAAYPASTGTSPRQAPLVVGNKLANDDYGRAVSPALYLTDVTFNASSTAGDWESFSPSTPNTTAQFPNYVGGTWKNNGAANPLGSDNKEAKNGADLGPHSEAFVANIEGRQGIEGYGAEVRWDISSLDTNDGPGNGIQTAQPGHTYRVEMMFHDGDHNADTGEACTTFTVPPKKPTGTTTASGGGQLAKDATGALSVSTFDTAKLTGGTRNAAPDSSSTSSGQLTFNLYQVNEDGNGTVDCGVDASGNAVNADLVATKTVNGTNGTPTGTTGGADNDAAHPLRGVYSTQSQPVKLTDPGTYYWTVSYSGNIENKGFDETDCGVPAEKVVVTKAPSKVDTTPIVKLSEDIKINLSASANAGIKTGDTVDVSLFLQSPTNTGATSPGCRFKDDTTGGGSADQQGTTKTVTLDSSNFNPTTGEVSISLNYPADFGGAAAPAIANGNYWWFVQYNGNDQVTGSNDDCHETFTISGL